MAERSIEFVDVFEQVPDAAPADWIGGFDPTKDRLDRPSATLDEVLEEIRQDHDLEADVEGILAGDLKI